MLIVGGRFDEAVAKHLHRPIAWVCRVTGRSNCWLARGLLLLSAFSVTTIAVGSVLGDSWVARASWMVAAPFWVLDYWVNWQRYERLSNDWPSGDAVSMRFVADAADVCKWRIRTLVGAIIFGWLDLLLLQVPVFGLALLAYGLAGYVAGQVTPPGKSAWSRAKSRVTGWRLPSLRPATSPA